MCQLRRKHQRYVGDLFFFFFLSKGYCGVIYCLALKPLPGKWEPETVFTLHPVQTQQNKKRKSRGKGKKARAEGKTDDGAEEGEDEEPSSRPVRNGASGGPGRGELQIVRPQTPTEFNLPLQPGAGPQLYPSWKKGSSDSEFSDPEGGMASKLRFVPIEPVKNK